MDDSHFDGMIRSLTQSRRSLLGAALAATTGWFVANGAGAKKKRKHKKRKGKTANPNAYGCLSVGAACTNAGQCCSGICDGTKKNLTCRAHGAGTCEQGALDYCASATGDQTYCNADACTCLRTTANSTFCGSLVYPSECADCQTDADCEAVGFPSGSACIPYASGICADRCDSGMACFAPCGASPKA